jgi:hypothetical protein
MGSRWVRACLDAIRADEPHRCSTKLEVAWVKKWWAEGQSWHKGAGGGGSSNRRAGAAHTGETRGGDRGSECRVDGDETGRFQSTGKLQKEPHARRSQKHVVAGPPIGV